MPSTVVLFGIGSFGALGAIIRFIIDNWMHSRWVAAFPIGTFAINLSGSFLLGLLVEISSLKTNSPILFTSLTVGFLGGFTTFSSQSLQVIQLWSLDQRPFALAYVLGAPILGALAAWCGMRVSGIF